MEENRGEVAIDHKENLAAAHVGPGIMLLTTSMQLLYKNRRAWELCQQIIRSQDGKKAKGVLPPAVVSLVNQIQKLLNVRTDPKDWEQLQIRRVVNTLYSSILLCGTALMDQTNAQERILIVISEVRIDVWEANVIIHATKMFHLTAREATVVQHLLKGWTNKEIANEMRLTELSIKEHFKHIAQKTSTPTRTGIIMKIIHSGLRYTQVTPSPHVMVPTMNGMPIQLVHRRSGLSYRPPSPKAVSAE